jgi:hypothetical protein
MRNLFNQFVYSFEQRLTDLFCVFAVGAAGAPTLTASTSKGIESVTRTGAGAYDIVLERKYVALLVDSFSHEAAAAEDLTYQISAVNFATRTISIITKAAAVATDPSNGSTIRLCFRLRNSTK